MQGPERVCATCGHKCHCYQPDCDECVNDVCTECNCHLTPPESMLPESFYKNPG